MRDLNYDLKQLCRHNRDGSYATQADREHILDLIADQLDAMGFRHMNAHSLKPKHVEKLAEQHKPKMIEGMISAATYSHAGASRRKEVTLMRIVPRGNCGPKARAIPEQECKA